MDPKRPNVRIENVVASAAVNQEIDLSRIAERLPDSEYNPRQFPGLVMRLDDPRATVTVFRTGKVVCTGAKSAEMAVRAVRAAVQRIRRGRIEIDGNVVVEIQNMVASVSLHRKIRVEQAARVLPRSLYEPEQFPGLIHRVLDPKVVFLIFASGKLVCTGARKEIDMYRAVHDLQATLEERGLVTT